MSNPNPEPSASSSPAGASGRIGQRGRAEKTGVTHPTILRLERGKFAHPDPKKLQRIAHALDLDVADSLPWLAISLPRAFPASARICGPGGGRSFLSRPAKTWSDISSGGQAAARKRTRKEPGRETKAWLYFRVDRQGQRAGFSPRRAIPSRPSAPPAAARRPLEAEVTEEYVDPAERRPRERRRLSGCSPGCALAKRPDIGT